MLNKILFVAILGVFAGLMPADAQTVPTAPARVKGKIIAARVLGHVDAISNSDGKTRVLQDGDHLADQTTIVTAGNASVILVFSNGATLNVAGDSSLNIEKFEQDPFSEDVKVAALTQEPSTSTTRLSLTKGDIVGKVAHLNVDGGSEFSVQTPVGAAGIRGTTFRIVFRPDPATGRAFFVVTTADGRVLFTGETSGPVNIPKGKQVVATFNYTPPSTPGGTGTATGVSIPGVTDVSLVELGQIAASTQEIVAAANPIVFSSSGGGGGGGNGNGGNNNTPPQPVQPQSALTAGAGSG